MPRLHDDALVPAQSARQAHAKGAAQSVEPGQQAGVRRLDERNAAIHAAGQLYAARTPYAAAKELHRDLRGYLARCWPREKYMTDLPVGTAVRRMALHRIARLNSGRDLSWRRLYDILNNSQPSRGAEGE